MNSGYYRKWKRITVFDANQEKIIYFELDENERIKNHNLKSKKISKRTKENTINNNKKNKIDFTKKIKMELTKNTTIFSRESNINQYVLSININGNESVNENSKNKKNSLENNDKIMDFDLVKLMVHDESKDWEDFYLFR